MASALRGERGCPKEDEVSESAINPSKMQIRGKEGVRNPERFAAVIVIDGWSR